MRFIIGNKSNIDGRFYETGDVYKEIAINAGFDEVTVYEVPFVCPFNSLDDALTWRAASSHCQQYDIYLDILRNICKKEDVSFLYDRDKPVYKGIMIFGSCLKR